LVAYYVVDITLELNPAVPFVLVSQIFHMFAKNG